MIFMFIFLKFPNRLLLHTSMTLVHHTKYQQQPFKFPLAPKFHQNN